MAKFRFELDPVLRARQREEDVIQRDVTRLHRQRTTLEDGLRNRQVRLSESKRSVRDQLVGTIRTSDVRMQANASLAIMRDAERTVLELAGIHQRLEEARSRLREAAKCNSSDDNRTCAVATKHTCARWGVLCFRGSGFLLVEQSSAAIP